MSWEPIDTKSPSGDAVIGDDPFDIIADAIKTVTKCYKRDLKRKPSVRELVTTFERVLETHFDDAVAEGETAKLVSVSYKIKPIPKRQKFKAGDFLKAQAADGRPLYGRVFEVHPAMGPLIGVYDSLGLEHPDWEELRRRRLVVKVTPIHYELLQERAWVVVGYLAINNADRNQPSGPMQISGSNSQLTAANFYYGLPAEKWFNIEEFINR